jgi:hypothetical protein
MKLSLDKRSYKLSKEEFNFYHENGYIIIKSLFSYEEVDRIYEIFAKNADENYSAIII